MDVNMDIHIQHILRSYIVIGIATSRSMLEEWLLGIMLSKHLRKRAQ